MICPERESPSDSARPENALGNWLQRGPGAFAAIGLVSELPNRKFPCKIPYLQEIWLRQARSVLRGHLGAAEEPQCDEDQGDHGHHDRYRSMIKHTKQHIAEPDANHEARQQQLEV
jgi:hypothetical protein